MTKARIRLAAPGDEARLVELRRSRRGGLAEATAWAERGIGRNAAQPEHYALYVAERTGKVVAYGVAAHFAPPAGSPANAAPSGYYLLGLVVHSDVRRTGLGTRLVAARLDWIAEWDATAWYFADDDNVGTIALHAPFGFEPGTTDFWFPGLAHPETPMTLYRTSLSD